MRTTLGKDLRDWELNPSLLRDRQQYEPGYCRGMGGSLLLKLVFSSQNLISIACHCHGMPMPCRQKLIRQKRRRQLTRRCQFR